MARLLGEHWEGDVRVRWLHDDVTDDIHVERHQDVESVIEHVAEQNAHGVKTLDGLGRPVGEVPQVVAMKWCEIRGIPWEKFLYSNEYDSEWPALLAHHAKLRFDAHKQFHAVS